MPQLAVRPLPEQLANSSQIEPRKLYPEPTCLLFFPFALSGTTLTAHIFNYLYGSSRQVAGRRAPSYRKTIMLNSRLIHYRSIRKSSI